MSLAVWDYRTADGQAEYDAYVSAQVARNIERLDKTWTHRNTITQLAHYLRVLGLRPTFALCHGTRRGDEQAWFREEFPGCEVWGTELAPTATDFPYTIQWDFHRVQPAWIGACDFIYSNALDHAYDPAKAVRSWCSCLTPTGVCLMEWLCYDTPVPSLSDPCAATLPDLVQFLNDVGGSAYGVADVFQTPLNGNKVFRKLNGQTFRSATVVMRPGMTDKVSLPADWSGYLPRMPRGTR